MVVILLYSMVGWDQSMLQQMCILAGCDYLESLPGVGICKAYKLIKENKSYDKASITLLISFLIP